MRAGSAINALHLALAAATYDLPPVRYWARDWTAYRALPPDQQRGMRPDEGPGQWKERRPDGDELEVTMFLQMWGSTALGYGGMGGAAMTQAYTVIVKDHRSAAVYFGCGRLAYMVNLTAQSAAGRDTFRRDVADHSMAPRAEASRYR